MPESLAPPVPPTVATVFSHFLKKLESDKVTDSETINRLQKAMQKQHLDPESLRAALFDTEPKQP